MGEGEGRKQEDEMEICLWLKGTKMTNRETKNDDGDYKNDNDSQHITLTVGKALF